MMRGKKLEHLALTFPRLSIIMPVLNSERTIRLSLESIRNQRYPQELVEILVIDGGSTDKTIAIANEFGAHVAPNPQRQQEFAKHIGLNIAQGDYAIFIDSDEVLENRFAFNNRIHALTSISDARIVLSSGYKRPKDSSSVNDYINTFSDPFAWFMQRTNSESSSKLKSWSRNFNLIRSGKEFALFEFGRNKKLPIVDFCAGSTLDLSWLRKALKIELQNADIVPRLFYLIVKKANLVTVLNNDPIIHYSSDGYISFLKKLNWRVKANIHHSQIPGVGYSNRIEFQSTADQLKKYLFMVYGLSIIGPIGDSLLQLFRSKKIASLVHGPLTVVTATLIVYNYILKYLRIVPKLGDYGKEPISTK
jgi:glycosyltransferase involved in cell wall biosynthesis